MSVLELIIDWANKDLLDWQKYAVRCLLTQGELSNIDKKNILDFLKAKYGLATQSELIINTKLLEDWHISGAPKISKKITLKAITNLINVNALPEGAELSFGHNGMTIIYGENAAGKSGYARVLKKACGARDTSERILPNVFKSDLLSPAKACFKISINDEEKLINWEDNGNGSDLLANISVFDDKCARVIINENNETNYLPYGSFVFEELVFLSKEFRDLLQKEKPQPNKLVYTDILFNSVAGQFLVRLSEKTIDEEIESVIFWNPDDEKKLLEIQKQVADIEVNDLEKQIIRLKNLKSRSEQFVEYLLKLEGDLSRGKEVFLGGLIKELVAAENAFAISSSESTVVEPLSGLGEITWRLLYEAAKEYSTNEAYIGKDFPYLGDDSRCVFCMQTLSTETKSRLIRFKTFMEKESKKIVDTATIKINDFLKDIRIIDKYFAESYRDVIGEARLRSEELFEEIMEFHSILENRAKGFIQTAKDKNEKFILVPITTSPTKQIVEILINSLEKEIIILEELFEPDKVTKLKNEKVELEARKSLTSSKQEIREYIEILKISKKYDDCIKETEFTSITLKSKKIICEALTPELKEALKYELKELQIAHLPLNLKPIGIEGETSHKMQLEGIYYPGKLNLTDILSEGEQHVVAIAGFLAELSTGHHECPIVFDDPVCSLDHKYREKIAWRLVKESINRQVIIFTHDIAFLLELNEKAKRIENVSFIAQCISKDIDELGKPNKTLPWHILEVNNRINYLEERFAKIKDLCDINTRNYNEKIGTLYGMLRATWEAAVEEILFNKTILRFGSEVQTLRLKSVEVTDDDYKEIFIGMEKCSTWMFGHDRAKPLDENRPSPKEVQDDLNNLKSFVMRVKKRNDQKSKDRKLIFETKTPTIG